MDQRYNHLVKSTPTGDTFSSLGHTHGSVARWHTNRSGAHSGQGHTTSQGHTHGSGAHPRPRDIPTIQGYTHGQGTHSNVSSAPTTTSHLHSRKRTERRSRPNARLPSRRRSPSGRFRSCRPGSPRYSTEPASVTSPAEPGQIPSPGRWIRS